MDPPASFSSLPPELVSKICSDPSLKKKDLIALRRTSKAQGIHASATKACGKRYFTDISLLYTEYSLETFVKICGHPVFGPGIRRVELSCTRFDTNSFDLYVKTLVDCGYTRKDLVHEVQLLSARCDAENLVKFSDANVLLQRAFGHLANSGHSLTIGVTTNEYRAIGRSRIFMPDDSGKHFYADVPSALNLLLGSAKQSDCKVSELDIAVASCHFYQDNDYDLSDLMHSISKVSLELVLIDDYGDDEPRDFILWMQDLLSHGTEIRVLELCVMIFDDDDDQKIEPFFRVISHLPLEELSLQDLFMNQKAMTGLMESLGSTLRRLTTCCCHMAGSWREVLLSMQNNSSQLDYLSVSDPRIPWLNPWKAYKGTTAVRTGLEEMLQAEQDANNNPDDQRNDD